MIKPRIAKSLTLFSFLLASSLAAQGQVIQEKDWILEKRHDPVLGTAACVASTSVASSTIQVKTELLMPQADDKGPLIILKAKGLAGQVPRAHVRPDAKTQYPMLLLSSDSVTGEDTFVLSPMRLPETLQIIAQKNTLDVYFGEGATAILARISLRGSSVTITRTAACRDSKVILKESLFNELKKDANLAQAQSGTVQDLMAAYQETLRLLVARDAGQLALINHQKSGAAVLAQEKAAADAVRVAAQREQDTLNTINSLKARIADLQTRIQRANAELPSLQASRPAAATAVANAERALSPHTPNIDRLVSEISIAQSEERRISSNISSLQSQLSTLQRQVQSLEAETDNARRSQQDAEREIQSINSQISQLESEYRNYDERREAQRILDNDSNFRRQQQELERWTRLNRELPSQVERARAESMEADRALKQCQAQPAPTGPITGGPLPPQPMPPGGGPRDKEARERERAERERSQPGVIDCSREDSRAREARRNFENKKSELQESDRRVSDIQSDIRRMENDAVSRARQGKDRLAEQINRLSQEQSVKRDQIARLDSRIRDLQQVEIPRKQREVESTRRQIADEQTRLSQAGQQTRRAQAELEQYKRSVGYDQLVANLNAAESNLERIDAAIASAQDLIKNGPGRIANSQAEQQAQEQELTRRQAARSQAEAVLANASQAANAHRAQETRLADDLRATQAALLVSKQLTQGLSKALYGF